MKSLLSVFVSFALFMSGAVMAETKVAVLDMELRDLTLEVTDPKKRAEIAANDQQNLALTQSLIREGLAPSLGGAETLVSQPVATSHYGLPSVLLNEAGISDRMIRLSVGLEAKQDLIADLEQALSGLA